MRNLFSAKWTDEKKEKALDIIKDLIIEVTRNISVFTIQDDDVVYSTDYEEISEFEIEEDMVGGMLIIEDAYKVKSGKEGEYCVICINESMKNPFWGKVRYYVNNQIINEEEYESYEDFLECINEIRKCKPFDYDYTPQECSSIELLDWYLHVRVKKEETGLPYDVILDSSGLPKKLIETKKLTEKPNLCIVFDDLLIPIIIDKNPKINLNYKIEIPEAEDVLMWISNHYEVLLQHWNKEITDREILNKVVDC